MCVCAVTRSSGWERVLAKKPTAQRIVNAGENLHTLPGLASAAGPGDDDML